MKTILLAIEGVAPDRGTFDYAVTLCRRMRAGLDILQILSPASCRSYLAKVKKSARNARSAFEDAMVAVTYAEAGRHDIVEQMKTQAYHNLDRLIPQPERDDIQCHLTLKPGNPDDEIVRYVHDHRNVVLTIYDACGSKDAHNRRSDPNKTGIPAIARKLPIPLVLRRKCEPTGP